MTKHTASATASKPAVGDQTFDSWPQAIEHASNLEMQGKISRRELNDVKTAAREAGHQHRIK